MQLLILLHRYLGVALCVFFAMWFGSGIVMLFVPYPSLTATERFAFLSEIDWRRVHLSPTRATTLLPLSEAPQQLRLTMIGERPVYHVHPWQGPVISIFADTGERVDPLSVEAATQVVSLLVPGLGGIDGELLDDDQWTVHQRFSSFRPLCRMRLQDAFGSEVYISARSGEVVQQTTRAERGWNYIGAVAHWLYPTVVRRHWRVWDGVVWWLALFGMVGVVTGSILGCWRTWQSGGSWSPYRGLWRWHHLAGLGCAGFVFTWILSGWLSMDHGRLFSEATPTREEQLRFRGGPLQLIELPDEKAPLSGAREVEWVQVAGEPFLLVHFTSTRSSVLSTKLSPSSFQMRTFVDLHLIDRATKAAFPGITRADIELITQEDDYHYRLESVAPPIIRARLDDASSTWLHIDARSGVWVEKLDYRRRVYRWLFSGLHRFDFAYFRARPWLRKIMLASLCTAGFLFSLSGVVLAWRRLGG